MDRELVLMVLALAWCTPLLLAASGLRGRASHDGSGTGMERACWRQVWAPVIPAAAAFTLLVGWALQEPDASDEVVHPGLLLFVLPGLVIWTRALTRAVGALRAVPPEAPAMTVGLLRPRVVIHPRLAEALDDEALRAVRAHEEAHARARDPLRLWLTQLVADMQWPVPAAARRLRAWRNALEIARDEEARRLGIEGADLAAALVEAARWRAGPPPGSVAAIQGEGSFLRERIARLLAPVPPGPPPENGWWRGLAVAGVLLGFAGAGVAWGDTIVQWLPGVLR